MQNITVSIVNTYLCAVFVCMYVCTKVIDSVILSVHRGTQNVTKNPSMDHGANCIHIYEACRQSCFTGKNVLCCCECVA